MKIDRALLPDEVQTGIKDGLYAEFYPDGQVALFGHYVEGEPRGWVLRLEPDRRAGYVEKVTRDRFGDDVPRPAARAERAAADQLFAEWAIRWIEEIAAEARSPIRCAFCCKSDQEVLRLIAGPTAYICNECVALCVQILEETLPR
jgi:hypothetical protein